MCFTHTQEQPFDEINKVAYKEYKQNPVEYTYNICTAILEHLNKFMWIWVKSSVGFGVWVLLNS